MCPTTETEFENVGDVGELCVKGPQVMKGYLHNQKATDELIKDGWLYTGIYLVLRWDVKGPQVMKGYLHNQKATVELIKDGWLYTGMYMVLRWGFGKL